MSSDIDSFVQICYNGDNPRTEKGVNTLKKTYPIITITRQYGCSGRAIGRMLAEELGIPFYDDEIIEIASQESHFDPMLFKRAENTNAANSFLYAIHRLGAGTTYNIPLSDQLFSATSSVIRNIAQTHPAVIVGRCADYILKEETRTLNLFIQADMEYRVKQTMERTGLTASRAEAHNKKLDRSQAAYYNFYADQKFGARENYDLVLNTTDLEPRAVARFLKGYVELVLGETLAQAKHETGF